MYRPKKHVRLSALPRAPQVSDVRSLLDEATKARGCTVEMPWRNKRTNVHYSLTVRVELAGGDPVWTLYEGEGGGSRVVWSSPFEDVELLFDVLTLSIPEEVTTDLGKDEQSPAPAGGSNRERPTRSTEIPMTPTKPASFYEGGLMKEEDLEFYKQKEAEKEAEAEAEEFRKAAEARKAEEDKKKEEEEKKKQEEEDAEAEKEKAAKQTQETQQPQAPQQQQPPYAPYPPPPGYGYPGYPYPQQQGGYPPYPPQQGYGYPPGYPQHSGQYPVQNPGQHSGQYPVQNPGQQSGQYPQQGYPPYGAPPYPPQQPQGNPQNQMAGTVAVQPGGVPAAYEDEEDDRPPEKTVPHPNKPRINVKLGLFLAKAGVVPQSTVDAALQLQDLVRSGSLPTSKAAEAVRRAHVRGGEVDPALFAHEEPGEESVQNIAPPLGQILVEAAILRGPVLRSALDLQQKVRKGVLTSDEAIDTLTGQVFGVGKKEEKEEETETSEKSVDLLKAAGLVSDFDYDSATKVRKKHGGRVVDIMASAGKLDKTTVDSALQCVEMIAEGRLKYDKAIIALHYCQRSRVGLEDALSELGWKEAEASDEDSEDSED